MIQIRSRIPIDLMSRIHSWSRHPDESETSLIVGGVVNPKIVVTLLARQGDSIDTGALHDIEEHLCAEAAIEPRFSRVIRA